MTRQLKFRAWTGDKMRLCSVSTDGKAMMDFGPSNAPVMQFTGLTDKNGKEIYEGDLVKYGLDKPDEVLFEDGRFTLSQSRTRFPICADFSKDMEVIGNVYELEHRTPAS